METKLTHSSIIFPRWAYYKVDQYAALYPDDFRKNPHAPPHTTRKGSRSYPVSLTKFIAAVYSVPYGGRLKRGIKLKDILGDIHGLSGSGQPSLEVFKTWRTEKRFKALVERLRAGYAVYVAYNICWDGGTAAGSQMRIKAGPTKQPVVIRAWSVEDGVIGSRMRGGRYERDLEEAIGGGDVNRRRHFVLEALNFYPPEFVSRINEAMGNTFNQTCPERDPTDWLGYYMWCVGLLDIATKCAPERSEKQLTYLKMAKKILGRQWEESDPKRKMLENDMEEGRFRAVRATCTREYSRIINEEIVKLGKGKNVLRIEDITDAINYLLPSGYVLHGSWIY